MEKPNKYISQIEGHIKAQKFKKKGNTWYQVNEEVIKVLNIQRLYPTADRYGVNLGIFAKVLDGVEFPKENLCHIRCRAESLWKEKADYIRNQILDFSTQVDSDVRSEILNELLSIYVADFFKRCDSLDSIKENWLASYFKDKFFHIKLHKLLSLDDAE